MHLAPCVNEVPELTARGKHKILVAGSAPQRAYIWRTSAVASAPSASGRDGACPGVFSTAIAPWQRIRQDPALLLRQISPAHAIRAAVVDVSCTPSSLRCFVELDSLQLREDTSRTLGAGRATGERHIWGRRIRLDERLLSKPLFLKGTVWASQEARPHLRMPASWDAGPHPGRREGIPGGRGHPMRRASREADTHPGMGASQDGCRPPRMPPISGGL